MRATRAPEGDSFRALLPMFKESPPELDLGRARRYYLGMDEIRKELEGIRKAFETHNELARAALEAIPKPENKFMRSVKLIALIAGAFALVSSADIVFGWIRGG